MVRVFSVVLLMCFPASLNAAGLADGQKWRAEQSTSYQIQAILDSISAENIHRYLDTLVGFTFRHTLDDTVSQITGMGATRRWIYKKFQEFRAASGGRLQPLYFDFVANICGVTQLHRNVMAVLPGTLTPDRYFVVSGHMDTRGDPNSACVRNIFSPGANDDGSGTVISLELARVLSKYQFDASLIFMAVTGEDEGLYGSEAYAAYADSINLRIDGMITNDVVGNIVGENGITDSTSVRHFSSVNDATAHRQLARYMKLKSEFYYPEMSINLIPTVDRPGRGGDHQSFQNHGYAAVRFTEPNENFGNQHTATDVVDSMSPAYSARVARVNAVGLASLAWAPEQPAPPTILDPGTGTTLIVQWINVQTEPDFAGYRIAVRDSGGLFYTSVVDAGNVTQDTIFGLTPDVPVYVGISAYDTAGNESLFSTEVFARPSIVPHPPAGVSATSHPNHVSLVWAPGSQLDISRYRIYRSLSRNSNFARYDSVSALVTIYDDVGLAPHTLYFYQIRAVDGDGNESGPSSTVAGQRVTHDSGILVVDGTRDGAGTPAAPTDSSVDLFYQTLLADFNVAGEWDVADSASSNIRISDAEMSPYSTILWHSDVRNSSPIYQDTTELRKYLKQGGRMFISGWKLSASLKSAGGVGSTVYPSGTFVPEMLKVDSTRTTGPLAQDFVSAIAAAPGYEDLLVDSLKIPVFGGTLVNTDAVSLPYSNPTVQTIYTHHSKIPGSQFEGKPVAWKYSGTDHMAIVFDFPLYFMVQSQAQAALRQALIELGELPVAVGELASDIPSSFTLNQNFPNPFNPSTTFTFNIPYSSFVILKMYDVLGQEVGTLVDEVKAPGSYSVTFDASSCASGVYFYRLNAGTFQQTRKMISVR